MQQTRTEFRVGQGMDIHPFATGRDLYIGGVRIPHARGLKGHSDADVLLHAVIDALFGAAGLPDIGAHFPDSDARWKDVSSLELLRLAWQEVRAAGFKIVNLDCTLLAQEPKVAAFIPQMKTSLGEVLGVETARIGIKATTAEGLGFVGRAEGVLASACVLLSCSCAA